MPPAYAGVEVSRKPTVVASAGAATDVVGRWDRGGRPSGI
jgi:hypothetical protein